MRYWLHPAARTELLESVRYYESQQPGLGGRFLETVADAINRKPGYWQNRVTDQ